MAIAFVKKGSTSGSGTTATVSLASSASAGNFLFATIVIYGTTSNATVSTSGWTALTGAGNSGALLWIKNAYKIAVGTETSVTFSVPSGGSWTAAIAEYSGVDTSTPVDVSSEKYASVTNPVTTNSITPASGVERLILAVCGEDSPATWSSEKVNSSTTGVTERVDAAGSDTSLCLFDRDVASTTGSYSASAAESNSVSAAVSVILAVKAGSTTTSVGNTYTGKYAILNTVGNTYTGNYSILNTVGHSYTGQYNILNTVGRTYTGQYTIFNTVGHTYTAPYSILNTVGRTYTGQYKILNTVGRTYTGQYAISGAVGRSYTGQYSILNTVGHSYTAPYSILNTTGRTYTSTYRIDNFVGATYTAQYMIGNATGGGSAIQVIGWHPGVHQPDVLDTSAFE